MPGFEIIVRPVVLPNIRPTPTRSLPPDDDPEQDKCVIGGGGGGILSITDNVSVSGTTHNPKETERIVDEVRVYQKEDNGTINKSNFVDMQVANKVKMKSGKGTKEQYWYKHVEEKEDIKMLKKDKKITGGIR